jgi:hypothetical protein
MYEYDKKQAPVLIGKSFFGLRYILIQNTLCVVIIKGIIKSNYNRLVIDNKCAVLAVKVDKR